MLNLNLHQSVTSNSSVTSSCCLPYARRHSTNVQRCTVLLSKAPALGSRIVADRIGWSSVGRQQQQWRGNRGLPALAAVKAPDTTVVALGSPSSALALAWLASINRSLFAAQCCVETCVQMYREGRSFNELQMGLQMMSSSGEDMAPPPLDASSTSILTQWVALVMLTLEELGVPQDLLEARMQGVATASLDCGDSPDPRVSEKSPYLQGMLSYVQQTLGMHESGTTLAMMSGLQDLVRSADTPPTVLLMQQYTRLVLLTVEVVAMLRLPCKRPLGQPSVVQTATDYVLGFQVCAPPLPLQAASASSPPAPSGSTEKGTVIAAARQPAASTSSRSSSSQQVSIMAAMETDSLDDDPEPAQAQSPTTGGAASSSSSGLYALPDEHLEDERLGGGGDMNGQGLVACPPARGVAVRMLVAFMAAVQTGSQWALNDFVTSTQYAYLQGLSARDLLSELAETEFLQSGGLMPLGLPPGAGLLEPSQLLSVNKQLFGRWLSLTYMGLAQLGVPYPGRQDVEGWAWAGLGDAMEAWDMASYTTRMLSLCQEEEQGQADSSSSSSSSSGSTQPAASAQSPTASSPAAPAAANGPQASGPDLLLSQPQSSASLTRQGPALAADSLAARLVDAPAEAREQAEKARRSALEAMSRGEVRGKSYSAPLPLVRMPDNELPASSAAVLLLSQQATLLRTVYGAVRSAREEQGEGSTQV